MRRKRCEAGAGSPPNRPATYAQCRPDASAVRLMDEHGSLPNPSKTQATATAHAAFAPARKRRSLVG